jgi:hypothetical protein
LAALSEHRDLVIALTARHRLPARQIRGRHGKLCLLSPDRRHGKIMIYGPKSDGTFIVEFKTAAGQTLTISVPSDETALLKHFQARMPHGLIAPDVDRPPDDG